MQLYRLVGGLVISNEEENRVGNKTRMICRASSAVISVRASPFQPVTRHRFNVAGALRRNRLLARDGNEGVEPEVRLVLKPVEYERNDCRPHADDSLVVGMLRLFRDRRVKKGLRLPPQSPLQEFAFQWQTK